MNGRRKRFSTICGAISIHWERTDIRQVDRDPSRIHNDIPYQNLGTHDNRKTPVIAAGIGG